MPLIEAAAPGVPNARWIAIRLLDGDAAVEEALAHRRARRPGGAPAGTRSAVQPQDRAAGGAVSDARAVSPADIIRDAGALRRSLEPASARKWSRRCTREVERVARRAVRDDGSRAARARSAHRSHRHVAVVRPAVDAADARGGVLADDRRRQRAVGDAGPGAVLGRGSGGRPVRLPAARPWWLTGFVWHGVYRGLAWVVSVMLPPMAIFFPLFTILEDLGYLPRVAFNLDFLFKTRRRARQAGADDGDGLRLQRRRRHRHARHRLAARAAGRDPHEQLRAVQRSLPDADHAGTVFVGGVVPAGHRLARRRGLGRRRSWCSASSSRCVVSWVLSRTILQGEASAFTLELPPYRRPEHSAHPLHLADRPDAVRAVAGDVDRGAGRRRHLAARQHPVGARAWRTRIAARSIRSAGRSASTA